MLYITATPIGNMEDISLRALRILKEVDFILAEDTRVTKKLLSHYEIDTKVVSYHQHSGEDKISNILSSLKEGKDIALVTDSGTPGVHDPGNELVSRVAEELPDEKITPIPGPNAAIAAASIAGFPMEQFCFLGFPPQKNKRKKFFERVESSEIPVILYESSHRIIKTLKELGESGGYEVVLGRELTKQFESVYRGNIEEVLEQLQNDKVKGEFTIILRKAK